MSPEYLVQRFQGEYRENVLPKLLIQIYRKEGIELSRFTEKKQPPHSKAAIVAIDLVPHRIILDLKELQRNLEDLFDIPPNQVKASTYSNGSNSGSSIYPGCLSYFDKDNYGARRIIQVRLFPDKSWGDYLKALDQNGQSFKADWGRTSIDVDILAALLTGRCKPEKLARAKAKKAVYKPVKHVPTHLL